MDISRIISFLKENYANNADEIYECLGLLIETIDSSYKAIQDSSAEAFDQRDFSNIKLYIDMADEINNFQDEIKGFMKQLRIENTYETVEESTEETDDYVDVPKDDYEQIAVEQNTNLSPDDYRVDNTIKHSLYEDFSFKKPDAFEFNSSRLEVKDWRELLYQTCKMLYNKDIPTFESFISDPYMNGRKINYFSKSRRGMSSPRKLPSSDIYVTMQLGANQVKVLIQKMLRKYNIDTNQFFVYFSEDYSRMLKK